MMKIKINGTDLDYDDATIPWVHITEHERDEIMHKGKAPLPTMRMIDLSRQCPLCEGADLHVPDGVLEGKDHIYTSEFFDSVNWDETLRLNGLRPLVRRT